MSNNGLRYLHGKRLNKANLDGLISADKEDSLSEIYRLADSIGIKRDEVNDKIVTLGYNNALLYTKIFKKLVKGISLPKDIYPIGIEAVLNKISSLKELKTLKEKSDLEISVQEIIKKFELSEKKLMQKEYRRKNPLTGKKESAEKPYRGHTYEHRMSRLDRSEE